MKLFDLCLVKIGVNNFILILIRTVFSRKTRKLSIGENKTILNKNKQEKLIKSFAQTLGMATTTIWNVLKMNETAGVPSKTSNRSTQGNSSRRQKHYES